MKIQILRSNVLCEEITFKIAKLIKLPFNQDNLTMTDFNMILKLNNKDSQANQITFSCISTVFSFKLLSHVNTSLLYRLINNDHEMIYRSEEQIEKKIFKFTDAYLEKFEGSNQKVYIQIYEKDKTIFRLCVLS